MDATCSMEQSYSSGAHADRCTAGQECESAAAGEQTRASFVRLKNLGP